MIDTLRWTHPDTTNVVGFVARMGEAPGEDVPERAFYYCLEGAPAPLLCDVEWASPDEDGVYEAPVCTGNTDAFVRLHAFDAAMMESPASDFEKHIPVPEPSQSLMLLAGVLFLAVVERSRRR